MGSELKRLYLESKMPKTNKTEPAIDQKISMDMVDSHNNYPVHLFSALEMAYSIGNKELLYHFN